MLAIQGLFYCISLFSFVGVQADFGFPSFGGNTSVLPSTWMYGVTAGSLGGICWQDAESTTSPGINFLLGPSFINTTSMTVEMCVNICEEQNYRIAGLHDGVKCVCANSFNPDTGFESDDGECVIPCVGNPAEACGGIAAEDGNFPLASVYTKNDGRCNMLGGLLNVVAVGDWRFIYWFNDTIGARALKHNAVDLHPGLPRGNLTIEACDFSLQGWNSRMNVVRHLRATT
ncbi:hypothetical protein M422DRAFT_263338 [Sphaerobolus stellatus SS14]|uniref:WSC domain-containing protein n=1 Tax=Sphaerobolus stellatus (strain SS14) TaxID=990650 RepID=A0A0C9UZ40_SPHS4|nr:hypothetical protein M422DRAFT_263338 [Sphaerobolus stellatus SS14]